MQRTIFEDLLKENRPAHLWLFFIISVIIHVLMIRLIVEAPLGTPFSKPNASREQKMGNPPPSNKRSSSAEFKRQSRTSIGLTERAGMTTTGTAEKKPSEIVESVVGEIRGVVRDIENRTVAGAEVRVVAIRTKPGFFYTTVTNAQGEYVLAEVPSGEYDIEVKAVPYRNNMAKKIILKSGEKVVMNITFTDSDTTMLPNTSPAASSGSSLEVSPQEFQQMYQNPYVMTFQDVLADISIQIKGAPPTGLPRFIAQVHIQEILGACITLYYRIKHLYIYITRWVEAFFF